MLQVDIAAGIIEGAWPLVTEPLNPRSAAHEKQLAALKLAAHNALTAALSLLGELAICFTLASCHSR